MELEDWRGAFLCTEATALLSNCRLSLACPGSRVTRTLALTSTAPSSAPGKWLILGLDLSFGLEKLHNTDPCPVSLSSPATPLPHVDVPLRVTTMVSRAGSAACKWGCLSESWAALFFTHPLFPLRHFSSSPKC